MKRINFNEFQQISYEDFNELQKTTHQSIYDKVLYPFFQKLDGCIGDGFTCTRTSATTVQVLAGRAYQYDGTQTGNEPKYRAIQLDSNLTLTIGAGTWATGPSAPDDRIDIIVIRALEETTDTASRYVKTGGTGPITLQTIDTLIEQTYEINVVEGTAAVGPSAPATPAGWMKIAQIYLTGSSNIVSSGDVTDSRVVLVPAITSVNPADRIVSPSGNGTDTTLAGAISNLPVGGGSILIIEDISIGANHNLPANTLLKGFGASTEITFTAGGKITANGVDCRIENLTFKTAVAALIYLLVVDYARFSITGCKFDLPAAGSNVGIDFNATDFDMNGCTFLEVTENGGTNISILIPSSLYSGNVGNIQANAVKSKSVTGAYTITGADHGKLLEVDSTTGAFSINLNAACKGFCFGIKDVAGKLSTSAVTLIPNGGHKIEGIASNYLLESDYGTWWFFSNGTDVFIEG